MRDPVIDEVLARVNAGLVRGLGEGPVLAVRPTWVETRRYSVLAGAEVRLQKGLREIVVKRPRLPAGASDSRVRKAHVRLRQEHDVPAMLRALGDGADGLSVVRPLALFDDLPALVMARSPGTPLLRVLSDLASWYPSKAALGDASARCAAAGRWLARFQAVTARPGDQVDLDDVWRFIDERLERLGRLGALPGGGQRIRSAIRRRYEALAAGVGHDERIMTGVHGDFSLSNVLSTETSTVVLDFSMFQTGSPVRDASRFYHQLGLLARKPAFRPRTIAYLQAAFLAAWSDRWTSESALFELCLLQHSVSRWLGSLKPDGRRSLRARLLGAWDARLDRRALERMIAGSA